MMTDSEFSKRAAAQQAVRRAIKDGLLPHASKVVCTDCGRKWTADGPRHEYDHIATYEKSDRLKVQAVCRPCHVKRTLSRLPFRAAKPSKVKSMNTRQSYGGRPPIGKEPRTRVNIMLEPTIQKYLREAGDGNVSAGIHIVTMGWMAHRAHEKLKTLPMPKKDSWPVIAQKPKRTFSDATRRLKLKKS